MYPLEAEKGVEMSFERIDKLPQWAQRRISKLEGDVVHYKERAAAVASKEGTNVRVDRSFNDAPMFLPEGTRVTFLLDDKRSIEVHLEGDGVSVYVGGGYLSFWPECANVGTLKVVQR